MVGDNWVIELFVIEVGGFGRFLKKKKSEKKNLLKNGFFGVFLTIFLRFQAILVGTPYGGSH